MYKLWSSHSDKKMNFLSVRSILISVTLILIIMVVIFVALTRKPPQYYVQYGTALGTNVKISYATSKGNAKEVVAQMFEILDKVNETFNPWLAGSALYNLNHSDGKWVQVSPQLMDVLRYAIKISQDTNGSFDPTIGRLIDLWGFNSSDSKKWHLPSPSEIANVLPHVGYQNVQFDGDKVRVLNGAWIDLGGIAKGYAVELLVKFAKENDPNSTGYVDIGGDIGIIGPKYGNQPWKIGIRNPDGGPNDAITYVDLYNGYIATSGDYERYIIVGGKRYYHILNPKTGYSQNYFQSVTSISDNGMLSDAFSTAAMVSGPNYLNQWAAEMGVAYLTINNGQMQSNELWNEYAQ
ncbi:MAG: FAD:protein FMN transferase [Mesoaciditoga sp.]|uniref:FAD:protein FMN transferase n=2 Tax=Athalassotoga sp. TaxID=2022597 RepID=UPI000CC03EAB|nr:MAG: FAD:protein FMN transferase [Mesoaciditoga sp.]